MADSSDSSDSSSISSNSEPPKDGSDASPKDVQAPDGKASKKKPQQKILFDFFPRKKKRGRPKKAKQKSKRGRPPSQPKVDLLLPALSIAQQEKDGPAPQIIIMRAKLAWSTS